MRSKFKELKLRYGKSFDGMYEIGIDNIGASPKTMKKCVEIVKNFTRGETFFFGFYRVDGFNLTTEKFKEAENKIVTYFNINGNYLPLKETIIKKRKPKTYSGYLTTASVPITEEIYELLPLLFHYYLEIAFFCPKIEWDIFVDSYRNYMVHGCSGYVLNDFTDFLFTYSDSGDFSIQFNPSFYAPNILVQNVADILNSSLI